MTRNKDTLPGMRSKGVAAFLNHLERHLDDDEGVIRAQTDAVLGRGASERGFVAMPSAQGNGKWVYRPNRLRKQTLLTKRHANMGCERSTQTLPVVLHLQNPRNSFPTTLLVARLNKR